MKREHLTPHGILLVAALLVALAVADTSAYSSGVAGTSGLSGNGSYAGPLNTSIPAIGGVVAMPSALPGRPGVSDQVIPAIAPASGPSNFAVVAAACLENCEGGRTVTFTMSKAFPSADPLGARFAASEGTTLVCRDSDDCDLERGAPGWVAVEIRGGGLNEVVSVEACDSHAHCPEVRVVFVETILALSPENAGYSLEPSLVSYRCNSVGDSGITLQDVWEDVYAGYRSALRPGFGPLFRCGGNTASTSDDAVNFEVDIDRFGIGPFADIASRTESQPSTISPACGGGVMVDVLDSPSLAASDPSGLCDLDYAPNGVVSYGVLPPEEGCVSWSLTGQQSGGIGPLRTINTYWPPCYPVLSLFIDAPPEVGALGTELVVTLVDQDGRPISGETVECGLSPASAPLTIGPPTLTTDENGQASFAMIPTTGPTAHGQELTITCILESNRDVRATTIVTTVASDVPLVEGCNFIGWTGADDTAPADLAARVTPAENLESLWAQQPPPNWKGFSSRFPEVSDLDPVDQLDVIAVCMKGPGIFLRPAI